MFTGFKTGYGIEGRSSYMVSKRMFCYVEVARDGCGLLNICTL